MPNRNKERDVVRSLLPSTRRDWAKWKGRIINRQSRRAIRQSIQVYNPEEADDSDLANEIGWAERTRQRRQRRRREVRQEGDKLGAFIRWGKFKTKDIENNEDKYFTVKSLLGSDNIITQHAMTHWEFEAPLEPRWDRSQFWVNDLPKVLITRDNFERALREGFESFHKEVNRVLKGIPMENKDYWAMSGMRHAYKKCKLGEDRCVTNVTHRRRVYVYHIPCPYESEGYRVQTSENKTLGFAREPVDSYIKETIHERHQIDWCPNLVILQHPDDVKKVTDYFFGGNKTKARYWDPNPWAGHEQKTVEQLVELFRRKEITRCN